MKTNELLEAAQLDALGLLDEQEQSDFEAALMAASPALRAQIREEQDRFARPDRWAGSVEPSPELRASVLARVRAEVTGAAPRRVTGKTQAAGRSIPDMRPVRRVSPAWRAAAMASAAAAVALAIFVSQQNAQMTGLAIANGNDRTIDRLVEFFGPRDLTDALFNANTRRVTFASNNTLFRGEASVWINSEWKSARFFVRNFETQPGETVRLVALREDGTIERQIAEFPSDGGLVTREITLGNAVPRNLAIYIAPAGRGASEGRLVMRAVNA